MVDGGGKLADGRTPAAAAPLQMPSPSAEAVEAIVDGLDGLAARRPPPAPPPTFHASHPDHTHRLTQLFRLEHPFYHADPVTLSSGVVQARKYARLLREEQARMAEEERVRQECAAEKAACRSGASMPSRQVSQRDGHQNGEEQKLHGV